MIETNNIYCEPCLETLSKMKDASIDCVITSPPYWQLRDYGYEGQWGLEPTYLQYLDHLWQMMDEIYRVLKPTGTAWINLGDTYSSNRWSNTPSSSGVSGFFADILTDKDIDEPNKCLLLIPHRFAIGCIDRGWIVRNDIIWAKRNGMPESVTDRFSKKHEFFFFMVKSQKYFFDLDAIRGKQSESSLERYKYNYSGNKGDIERTLIGQPSGDKEYLETNGKNPGSVSDFWDIPTKPSSEKHYASYNDSLLVKPVLAGCPEFVCDKCGKPRQNIYENQTEIKKTVIGKRQEEIMNACPTSGGRESTFNGGSYRKIIGLTDCGCGSGFSGGIIYDPFMGTGSTAEVALRSNRRYIGSEMSKDYCEISEKRLMPFKLQLSLF